MVSPVDAPGLVDGVGPSGLVSVKVGLDDGGRVELVSLVLVVVVDM